MKRPKKFFFKQLRAASRQAYVDGGMGKDVAAAFGDALTFYLIVGELDFKTARAIANAAYFYPNDLITAADSELLKIKGIGPVGLRKIRRGFGDQPFDAVNLSVCEFLNLMTGEKDRLVMPTRIELRQI